MWQVYNHTQRCSATTWSDSGWSNIAGSTIVLGKVTLYQSLLGKVSNKFEGGGISMNRLKDNFNELLEDRTEEVIQQYTRAYIMRLIGGILMLKKSQNVVHISSVTQSVDEGREAVIDSVRDGGNTQNKLSVVALQVEATNFTATARLEGAAQGGHAREGQHQLVKAARGAHQGSGS
ncbi:hypothetical protein PVK06_035057 [Gossypium arboreum]|uniref:Uncharacterized protein n=1 Tax=Gossypium arboreum TaxID=29729 RepID=A0ABR0NFU8_GOSAR|nr:hypothetical protein PVK06_035057 [Gossypium arboreum]